jgi:hypothetical protein
MSAEVMFVAIAGMITFLVMVNMINKAEIEKARAKAASAADRDGVKGLLEDNATEIARLRARVEVLERLATDGDRKLAGEIDRLRTDQRVSP